MASRYGIAVLALALTLTAGCGSSGSDSTSTTSAVPGFQIVGSWSGELHQKGLQPFRVTSNIRDLSEPAKNTVHYTGIDCDGNWTYLGSGTVSSGGTGQTATGVTSHPIYRFREVINRGIGGNCKGVGRVTLTARGPNTLDYVFRGGGVESRGQLTRSVLSP
jgi:hypothetical protein